ncbi:ATP-dependent zinc metalloprotease FtsH [Clostridium tarantellae]|uniref:ATP-dependent zinc metalloprotease FtsH n=1 Tax=Clostridium tarantellae TaxID=39493 RepID=A0A6I1MPD9_9CLOT|nr:ATP-dependent zinc metalloprotease FtsH [Clostridium tarantellae]MPQ42159.1 ATP-dependent zinc metalloprotease FtsH [Clostridium tarantellae]
MKKMSSLTAWIIIFFLIITAAYAFYKGGEVKSNISYSSFEQKWKNDEVKKVTIIEEKDSIEGVLKDGTTFNTYAPAETFSKLMQSTPSTADVTFEPPANMSVWFQVIPTILMMVIFLSFFFMFMQQSQGGGGNRGVMNFGKSRAKLASPDSKKVTFKDVAGADEEKAELEEIVDFLKQPKRYIEMGARIPKGVLLVGPPGTGKTLLAKAIAGEAGVPFFSISGSDFVEMFVGVGASRVRDLFEQAKKNAPCIVFIDEIDAVGRQRGAGVGGGHDEREQTLNQLLVEMDGFGVNEGIIMIAATNRPDILDPALLRPGRFDRQIVVGAPDVTGREEILKVHTRNKPLNEEVELKVLAKRTPGFSGADLENLTNEAALLAVRRKKQAIDMNDMEEAITRVIAGPEKKSRVISEHDKRITAFHEAGHAVVMRCLEHADPVHEISIIPRGMAAGYTMHLPDDDRSHVSKSKLKDEMVGLLGGRVAEKLVIGDISTGAKNDIDRTSSIARNMVMQYGMSDEIGPISFGQDNNEVFLGRDIGKSRNVSEEISSKIDKEIKGLVDEAYERAERILQEHMSKLHAVAETLLEKEKIDGNEFENIFKNS